MNSELIGLLIGLLLTLLIYSTIWRDTWLYRLALHILVGVSAAYAAVIATQQVILPIYEQIQTNPSDPATVLWLIPIFLAALLLLKILLPAAGGLGNSAVALLVGVGAAVALVGAIRGTLIPQVTAVDVQDPWRGLAVGVLTICTLLTFQFTQPQDAQTHVVRRLWRRSTKGLRTIGQVVLMITFGTLFASVLNTSLVLLIERINFFMRGLLP